MAKTQYLSYTVHLDDQAVVEAWNLAHPNGVIRAPYAPGPPAGGMAVEAANEAGIAGPLPVLDVGDPFVTNSLTSEWFTNSNTFPRDVATFTKSSGWWIFGSSTTFNWVAHFVYSPAPDGESSTDVDTLDVTQPAPIPARYFIDGFEILEHGEGSTNAGRGYSRAGATLDEGMGFAYRNAGTSATTRNHSFAAGVTRNYVWNRLYVRLRKTPDVITEVFRLQNDGTVNGGARLTVAGTGALTMYVHDGTTLSLVGITTGALVVGHRHKIDVLGYIGDNGSGTAVCIVYYFLDGTFVGTSTHNPGGLVGNAKVASQTLGNSQSVASTLEIDFDDWVCAPVPDDKLFRKAAYAAASTYIAGDLVTYTGKRPTGVPLPVIGFEMFRALGAVPAGQAPRDAGTGVMNAVYWVKLTDSIDWTMGSRIILLNNTAFAQSANWTGDYRLASSPFTRQTNTGGLTSGTSAAVVAMTTDAVTRLANVRGAQGWAAVNIGVESNKTAAAADGSVGYKIGGATAVYATITGESTAGGWANLLYAPSALQEPEAIVAVEAHYKKGADANTSRVRALLASVELLGVFSDCDLPPDSEAEAIPVARGAHNAPYSETPWFRNSNPPLSPVILVGGLYTGNDTAQQLTFPAPVHAIIIRPLTGDTGGARYFSAAPTIQRQTSIGAGNDLGPGYARVDPSFTPASDTADQQMQVLFPIAGTDTQFNASGTVYQYIAICDPGGRFVLNGASYHEAASGLLPVTEALENASYLPEFGLFWRFDFSVTGTDDLWTKGGGHTTAQASKVGTGTPVASAVTFGTGSLTWDSGFVDSTGRFGTVYVLFRRDDGNDVAGTVCQSGTYVGDGSGARGIAFVNAPGVRPLYAIVQPHNAAALHRDPSHTGTTSSQLSNGTANAATGITAGALDGFTVGTALNSNGVTYNWLVILGSATAGNNGWSANGTITPVPSESPTDGYELPPGEEGGGEEGGGEEGGGEEENPDLSAACVAATQRLVNIALSRIGVSKVITDLADENTMEAVIARLHIKTDVEAVLADFPWPFATRYADLVVVGGTDDDPVNVDWQYSYRTPSDFLAARRIGGQMYERRAYDPNPITYRLGTDATGSLIYSNAVVEDDQPVVLEYTARVSCPASTGSPLFKDALAWRFAASLAMPLSRDSQKQAYCLAMYQLVLRQAEAVAANESQLDKGGDAPWIAGR